MSFNIRCYIVGLRTCLAPIELKGDSDTDALREAVYTEAKAVSQPLPGGVVMYKVKRSINVFDESINLDSQVNSMFKDGKASKDQLQELGLHKISKLFTASEHNDDMLHIVVVVPKGELLLLLLRGSIFYFLYLVLQLLHRLPLAPIFLLREMQMIHWQVCLY